MTRMIYHIHNISYATSDGHMQYVCYHEKEVCLAHQESGAKSLAALYLDDCCLFLLLVANEFIFAKNQGRVCAHFGGRGVRRCLSRV